MLIVHKKFKETKKNTDLLSSVYFKAIKLLDQGTADTNIKLYFVSPKQIRAINRKNRQKDTVTDVLSFPYTDLTAGEKFDLQKYQYEVADDEAGFLLGEIFICLKRAKQQAKLYGHSLKREVCFLLVHGILHLHGYDHVESKDEEKMFALQDKILKNLGIER